MPKKQPYEIHPNEWPKFLTPDLERHFERIGEDLVRHDVAAHRYQEKEKHFAALCWLKKKRDQRDHRGESAAKIMKLTLIVATLTLVVSLIAMCQS